MRVRPLAVAVAVLSLGLSAWSLAECGAGAPSTDTPAQNGEQVLTSVYTTGYTWYDNTPPGSGRISNPQLHTRAGGTGTWADPITVAVGHVVVDGRDTLDLPAGTRLYVPHVRRYFVVEDSCGDGARPQDAGCHDLSDAPKGSTLWVDLYVGGSGKDSRAAVQSCAGRVTDGDGRSLHTVVVHPRSTYLTVAGPLFAQGRCTALYPDRAVGEVG